MSGVKILMDATMKDLGNQNPIVSREKMDMMITAEQTQAGASLLIAPSVLRLHL